MPGCFWNYFQGDYVNKYICNTYIHAVHGENESHYLLGQRRFVYFGDTPRVTLNGVATTRSTRWRRATVRRASNNASAFINALTGCAEAPGIRCVWLL